MTIPLPLNHKEIAGSVHAAVTPGVRVRAKFYFPRMLAVCCRRAKRSVSRDRLSGFIVVGDRGCVTSSYRTARVRKGDGLRAWRT